MNEKRHFYAIIYFINVIFFNNFMVLYEYNTSYLIINNNKKVKDVGKWKKHVLY